MAHLLEEMAGLKGDTRAARFVCVAAWASPDGASGSARGECPGRILDAPRGEGGFGYDPVFWSTEREACVAELDEATKNAISHRGRAFLALRGALLERLRGLR